MIQLFRDEIPSAYRQEFLQSTDRINRLRAEKFAVVIGVVNLILLFILDLPRYRSGAWNENDYFFYAFVMHVSIVVLNSAYFFLSRAFHHSKADRTFSLFFVVLTLLWCAVFALLAQLIHGDTVVYSMGLFGISVSFYFTPIVRTFILAGIQTFILIGLQFFQPEDRLLPGIYINSIIGVILCWIISRFFLAIKLNDFLQLKEIQKKQAEIITLNNDLTLANQEKNEFLGIAAHDLKNPLTGIMMNAEMVRMYAETMHPDEIAEHMEKIENTSRRMRDIITNLLDINTLDTGSFTVKMEDINLSDLLKSIVDDERMNAEVKGIHIQLEFNQADEISFKSDPQALREIIENLISNAIKFSPVGGRVYVRLKAVDSKVIVEIEDEGQGFSEDDRNKIFHRFAKLSARPTAGEHSTGLGLSIVKKLVDLLGGSISLISESGKGAKFTLEFQAEEKLHKSENLWLKST